MEDKERELVPVKVKPREKAMEQEELKPIEELPENWHKTLISNRWRVR